MIYFLYLWPHATRYRSRYEKVFDDCRAYEPLTFLNTIFILLYIASLFVSRSYITPPFCHATHYEMSRRSANAQPGEKRTSCVYIYYSNIDGA